MKIFLKKSIIVVFFIFVFLSPVLSQSKILQGKPLSDALYKTLQKDSFTPQKHALMSTESHNFPYNITISFNPETQNKKNNSISSNTVILAFTQSNAYKKYNELKKLLNSIQKNKHSYIITILLSSDSEKMLPEKQDSNAELFYIKSIHNKANTCVITITFSSLKTSIIPGSGKKTSPEWLIKSLSLSLQENSLPYDIQNGNILSMYRLGILKDNKRLADYLTNNISAAGLNIKCNDDGNTLTNVFTKFFILYNPQTTQQWDNHYLCFKFFNKVIWLKENFLITLYIIIACISLLLLCGFSFTFGKNRTGKKRQVIKAFYILPLSLVLASISLYIGQWIAYILVKTIHIYPIMQFAIKIFFSFISLTCLFLFEINMHIRYSSKTYTYLETVSAVINIFLFSLFDLSLIFLFTIEYLITITFHYANKLSVLFLSMICLFIPLFYYMIPILKYGDFTTINSILYCSIPGNFLSAAVFLPFYMLWLKILFKIHKKEYSKAQGVLKTARKVTLQVCILITFLVILFIATSRIFDAHNIFSEYRIAENKAPLIDDNTPLNLSATVKKYKYLGLDTRTITIHSKKPASRIMIEVQGNGYIPVYDSVSEFTPNTHDGSGYFIIPDYPPEYFQISYTSANTQTENIIITGYYKEQNKKGITEFHLEKIPLFIKNKKTEN